MNPPPLLASAQNSVQGFHRRNAAGLKRFLILLLLIPLGMVKSTLRERLVRPDAAVGTITHGGGKPQRLLGRMEDFALRAGTAALFAVLAAVMYVTRRLDAGEPGPAGLPAEVAAT